MLTIAPSILSADFSRLGDQVCQALDAGVSRIHVDIMDGQFVPTLHGGPLLVEALHPLAARYTADLEVHLMTVQPDRFLADMAQAGASVIIVHVEACPHLHRTVHAIRALGARPGVALNPATPPETLTEILPDINQVLVMTVDPGFGGQDFIAASVGKISRLRAMFATRRLSRLDLEVDGGISTGTIASVAQAGATIAVAGSAVFGGHTPIAENIRALGAAARYDLSLEGARA